MNGEGFPSRFPDPDHDTDQNFINLDQRQLTSNWVIQMQIITKLLVFFF